ncbi:wax ester/triacylglycerol synthase family O-acyltransferase [Streptomyces sp. TRM66268-LWL]|uniref:Diacylglycerol O-acyltransferase n=1 Tax=Streptomyces polyasparticus TaxID=2767826 RepID=A0ABR7SFM6_9ACTN|nr:wax ester/triacylglycerol synthase family O-acyltransferase [Streptomyces polyasparticus]MBC9713777.1 wax ester/triacylglycerol synthase family O-acyltransferase [Streptomyces polyasparticus]
MATLTDPLAPLDLAFWNIESPEHPMHLGALGVFTCDSASAAQHAADLLMARAPQVPGLRMRIRDVWFGAGGAVREPVPDFDPAGHVRLAPETDDFHAAAGALMERPLDRSLPPWEAHVLPAADGGSFAVLFKFHHALADGLRALTLAAGVMDPQPVAPRPPRPAPTDEGGRGLLGTLAALPGAVPRTLRRQAGALGQALDIGASVARATWDVRSTQALTSQATGTRRTAGAVLDLDDIHRIRKKAGGTVNDVLIAVVAGALREWLSARGEPADEVRPRALIPVSRRRPRAHQPQGNRLSGYLIRLPVDEADPLTRLGTVRGDMDRSKDDGAHRGAGAVALLADHVPPLAHRLGGPLVAQSARLLFDILVTSVPLPSLGLRLAGCPLAEVYPFAPLAQGQSLAIAVSTYRGRVHYGLVADAEAVPDLDGLGRALMAEAAVLSAAAGV